MKDKEEYKDWFKIYDKVSGYTFTFKHNPLFDNNTNGDIFKGVEFDNIDYASKFKETEKNKEETRNLSEKGEMDDQTN